MLSEYRISEADNAAYLMSKRYAGGPDQMLFDDFHSAILEGLFVKCSDNMPLNQIIAYARMEARALLATNSRFSLRIDELYVASQDDDADEYSRYSLDILAEPTPWQNVEDQVIQREEIEEILTIFKTLPPMQQKCVELYALGFRPATDPETHFLCRSKFYHYVKRAKDRLQQCEPVRAWTAKLAVIHRYEATHAAKRNWAWNPQAAATRNPYAPVQQKSWAERKAHQTTHPRS